jgi:LPS sulfotransferase NodH
MLDDARVCVAKLEQFDADFDELLSMFKGKTLFNNERRSAQQKLRLLKEALASEVTRLQSAERKNGLTHIEDAYYFPAIRQARADMTTAWNAIPDGKWHADLYGSHISITHALFSLKGQIPK